MQVCQTPDSSALAVLDDHPDLSDISSESLSPPAFSPAESSSTEAVTSTSPPTSSADEEGSNLLPQVQSPFHDSTHSSADEEGSSLHHDHLSASHTTLPHSTATASRWTGFRIVGDNIDLSLRPRHQTLESRTHSFHYFNSYAVLDRCDLSGFEENITSPSALLDFNVELLLPTSSDLEQLYENMATIVGRMLTEHIPGFEKYKQLTTEHIKHKRYEDMCKPSVIVSHNCNIMHYSYSIVFPEGAIRDYPKEREQNR